MSRRSVPRDTAKALVPVLVPLVTKVVLPIVIESMRRRKFDPDQYLEEARESLGKGLKKSRAELDDVKDEVVERGQKVYDEARKQGAELLEILANKGAALAEELMDRVQPPRRRGFPFFKVLAVIGLVGVGVALLGRK
jgi:vacuolar-type H+-ATPase subunit H